MRIALFLLSAIFLLLTPACSEESQDKYTVDEYAEADWDRYAPADLSAIIKEHSAHIDFSEGTSVNINASAINNPYRVEVEFLGEVRKIGNEKKLLLDLWARSHGGSIPKRFTKAFGHEALFRQVSTLYWFPIQSQLVPFLQDEVKKNERVYLYTMFVGTVLEEEEVSWVFLINEFRKAP